MTGRVSRLALLGLAAVAAALALLAALYHADRWAEWLHVFETHAHDWRRQSPVLVALGGMLLVAAWIVCLVPSSPLELALGYLFGIGGGFLLVYFGKVLGCGLSYVLGRTALRRGCGEGQLLRHELLQAMALAARRQPYRCCLLVRAAYIPIAIKNYGMSLLGVAPRPYFAALLLVELWNSFELIFFGSSAQGALAGGAGWVQKAWLLVACASLLALGIFGAAASRRALAQLRLEAAINQGVDRLDASPAGRGGACSDAESLRHERGGLGGHHPLL